MTWGNIGMERDEIILKGRSIAPGIGIGISWKEELQGEIPKYRIQKTSVKDEKNRLRRALHSVRQDLRYHISSAHGLPNDELHQVLKAHQMMVRDQEVLGKMEDRISIDLKNADWAVSEEITRIVVPLQAMRDPYLQARAEDIRDLGSSILKALSRKQNGKKIDRNDGSKRAMITHNLFPSLAMMAQRNEVVGFATESPAVFSHAAIILKGFGIPVVGAIQNLLGSVNEGDEVIVDGMHGTVIVRPEESTRANYLDLFKELEQKPPAEEYRPVASFTHDGVPVKLMANIEHPNQTYLLSRHKLEGVGLFRTEFLALERGFVPDEDEQFRAYREVIEQTRGIPVVFRTFDIGADKNTAGLHQCAGMNPALGLRGIRRHLLSAPEELRGQIKAILRAAVDAEIGIMFPMVTDLDDIKKAREHMYAAKEELRREEKDFAEHVRIGAMIEVPSAAILTAEILELVDFVSIGTNDLLQYLTGADRDNLEVLSYQDPGGPAFGWLLGYMIAKAREIGRESDVNICGEIAGNIDIVPMLLKMGFRTLSIAPVNAEEIRACISKTLVG